MSALSAQNLASGAAQNRNNSFGAGANPYAGVGSGFTGVGATPRSTNTPQPTPNPSAGPAPYHKAGKGDIVLNAKPDGTSQVLHALGHSVSNTIGDFEHHGLSALFSRAANVASDIVQGAGNLGVDAQNAVDSAVGHGVSDAAGWAGAHGVAKDIRGYVDTHRIPEIVTPKFVRDSNTDALNKVGGSLIRNPDVGTVWSAGMYVPGKPVESVLRVINGVGTVAMAAGGAGELVKGAAGALEEGGAAVARSAAGQAVKTGVKGAAEEVTGTLKGTVSAAKTALTHNQAVEDAATAAANREAYLKTAADNLQSVYNRDTGATELRTNPYDMVIQRAPTRGQAVKTSFTTAKNSSKVARLAEDAANADRVPGDPSFGSEITKPAAAASKGLAKDVNASGGDAEKAINGLESDVEKAFPKDRTSGNGSGKGKGSGDGSGRGSGTGDGNGSGTGRQGTTGTGGRGGAGPRGAGGTGARPGGGGTATLTRTETDTGLRGGGGNDLPDRGFTKPAPEKLKVPTGTIPGDSKPTEPEQVIKLTNISPEIANLAKPDAANAVSNAVSTANQPAISTSTSTGTQTGTGTQTSAQLSSGVTTPTAVTTPTGVHAGDDTGGGGGGGGHEYELPNLHLKGTRMWQQLGR